MATSGISPCSTRSLPARGAWIEIPSTDFVTGETEDVKSVQFVYATEDIRAPEPQKEPEKEEQSATFLDKLRALFR